MTKFVLHIPLQMPRHQGFFKFEPNQQSFLGNLATLALEGPYVYLKLEGVAREELALKLDAARRCLSWAAVRLDQGIVTSNEPLRYVDAGTFDGQFPTAVPVGSQASPLRVESSHRSDEPSIRFFAALNEAARQTTVIAEPRDSKRLVACEIFSAVDFESSVNAQFLALTMVLEVLAAPKERPRECVGLVEDLLERVQSLKLSADDERKLALISLEDSVKWLKQESITSSIGGLAEKAATVLGDANPAGAGKGAKALYGKRSKLVHKGKSVTNADVLQVRKLARECLAVEIGCYHSIRERFP